MIRCRNIVSWLIFLSSFQCTQCLTGLLQRNSNMCSKPLSNSCLYLRSSFKSYNGWGSFNGGGRNDDGSGHRDGDMDDDDSGDYIIPIALTATVWGSDDYDDENSKINSFFNAIEDVLTEIFDGLEYNSDVNSTNKFSGMRNVHLLLLGLAQGYLIRSLSRLSLGAAIASGSASYMIYRWASSSRYLTLYWDRVERDIRTSLGQGRYKSDPLLSQKGLKQAYRSIHQRAQYDLPAAICLGLGLIFGFFNG